MQIIYPVCIKSFTIDNMISCKNLLKRRCIKFYINFFNFTKFKLTYEYSKSYYIMEKCTKIISLKIFPLYYLFLLSCNVEKNLLSWQFEKIKIERNGHHMPDALFFFLITFTYIHASSFSRNGRILLSRNHE